MTLIVPEQAEWSPLSQQPTLRKDDSRAAAEIAFRTYSTGTTPADSESGTGPSHTSTRETATVAPALCTSSECGLCV